MGVSSDFSESLQIPQKWRETKHLWDKDSYMHLKSGFQKILVTDKKKNTLGGAQTSLLKWQALIHGVTICPLPEGSLT